MERVYLGDWLYNAGIIGFLKIIGKENVNIGENYIEFNREIFKGFSEKFFDCAFKQYGRYENILASLKKYEESITENNAFSIHEKIKNILDGFKLLKEKLEKLPSKKEIKKNPENLKDVIIRAISILKSEKQEFYESDVQIYLRKIYGQKSFLNKSTEKDRFLKFKNDFEDKLLNDKNNKKKVLKCVNCQERFAKKGTIFDTGISKFYGLNQDSINLVWNFKPKLPLCDICEIIYFCYFAGLTPVYRDGKNLFYFVNFDSSVEDLLKANELFKEKVKREDNYFIEFFTELVLFVEKERAGYILQGISIIEADLQSEVMPKIYSFNVSRQKAKFFKNNLDFLKKISRKYYIQNDQSISILPELIHKILSDTLNYDYLFSITKYFLQDKTNFTPYSMQMINLIISDFMKLRRGGDKVKIEDRDMWAIYYRGKELSNKLIRANAENKISSISFKLLNALRVGNTNQFMDTLMRLYLSYNEEIPSIFVKAVSDKEAFYMLGYSFLNGFLSKGGGDES